MPDLPAAGPSPVESIRLVERFERRQPGFAFTATSLPGHLIHLVLAGGVEQSCNGRRHRLSPGDVIWYHEDEWVEGRVRRAPWIYYSVNFAAPALSPPDFARRVFPAQRALAPLFADLLAAWRDPESGAARRDLLCQSRLLAILAALSPSPRRGPPAPVTSAGRLWWDAEAWFRQRIERPVSLDELAAQFQRSPNTLARACREAVGQPPMRRLKGVRLSLARGLVHYSELNMTEIARRAGYGRVHEFSRDYRKAFGRPPTEDRAART